MMGNEFHARQLWRERGRMPVRMVRLLTPARHWGEAAWTAILITPSGGPLLKQRGRITSILRESTLRLKWERVP